MKFDADALSGRRSLDYRIERVAPTLARRVGFLK